MDPRFRGALRLRFLRLPNGSTSSLAPACSRHLIALPIAYFAARRAGDSVARVRALENIRNFLTSSARTLVAHRCFPSLATLWLTARRRTSYRARRSTGAGSGGPRSPRVQFNTAAAVNVKTIDAFAQLMNAKLGCGRRHHRRGYIRAMIDAVEVGNQAVWIIGDKDILQAAIAGKNGNLRGFVCPSLERGDSSFRRHGLHNGAFCGERRMPWKACKPMDERLKFIARLLDGEQMAPLCREFGISRKTGYKILTRYNKVGLEGLTDRSRRPYRHANQLPTQIETLIARLKEDKPSRGAPKIRDRLARLYPDVHTPAISTVHAVLDRHGLVKRRTAVRKQMKVGGRVLPGYQIYDFVRHATILYDFTGLMVPPSEAPPWRAPPCRPLPQSCRLPQHRIVRLGEERHVQCASGATPCFMANEIGPSANP